MQESVNDVVGEVAAFRSCIFCRDIFASGHGFRTHLLRVHANLVPELKKKLGLPCKHYGRWNEL